jgi:hypothetical protein
LVAAALEVLLRLTPLPPGCDSCFKSLARPDVSPVRSLAMPLLAHCDTVKALAGCIWSSWSDVQTKAVSQQLEGGGLSHILPCFHSLTGSRYANISAASKPRLCPPGCPPRGCQLLPPACLPACHHSGPLWGSLRQPSLISHVLPHTHIESHHVAVW